MLSQATQQLVSLAYHKDWEQGGAASLAPPKEKEQGVSSSLWGRRQKAKTPAKQVITFDLWALEALAG